MPAFWNREVLPRLRKLKNAVKWIGFGIITGAVVGLAASILGVAIGYANNYRAAHPWVLFCMPLAGLFIVFLYQKAGEVAAGGTNLLLTRIRDRQAIPGRLAPLIFVSTILTHLVGGSAGREGAALQMGGSLGNFMARIFHFYKSDNRRATFCGMSAAFSALFGTPLAATIMPLEMSTVGIVYFSSLTPCAISSLIAYMVREHLGTASEAMVLHAFPEFTLIQGGKTMIFAFLCAMVSILFCVAMRKTEHTLSHKVPNGYIRVLLCSAAVIIMTLLVGDMTYNGAGMNIIQTCIGDYSYQVNWYTFLLKIIFTVITLSGGFKGGEIVPSLFIGATFGAFYGQLAGDTLPYAAMGMGCVFCGITNCPITSLLICFELFGFDAMPYFLLAIAISYLFSGNYGIYSGQRIRYSKFYPGKIDELTHD